jgi:predicted nucleic acid-binding protein
MRELVFDTRFFVEYFYSADNNFLQRANAFIIRNKGGYISALTVHEIYLLSLKKEGRETARIRLQGLLDRFRVVDVSAEVAVSAAELRQSHKIPLADGVIAATCSILNASCVTDDPHFHEIKQVKALWV